MLLVIVDEPVANLRLCLHDTLQRIEDAIVEMLKIKETRMLKDTVEHAYHKQTVQQRGHGLVDVYCSRSLSVLILIDQSIDYF